MTVSIPDVTIGVLALQGAFSEHVQLLRKAADALRTRNAYDLKWQFLEVRTLKELEVCDGLIIPGGESTTISLVAARSGMLEPLRDFVKLVFHSIRIRCKTVTDTIQGPKKTCMGNMRRAYSPC